MLSLVKSLQPLKCRPPGSSVHEIFQVENWSGLPFPTPYCWMCRAEEKHYYPCIFLHLFWDKENYISPIRTTKVWTNLKIKNSLRDLWGNIKGKNIPILGVSERWREKKQLIIYRYNYGWKVPKPEDGNKLRYPGRERAEGPIRMIIDAIQDASKLNGKLKRKRKGIMSEDSHKAISWLSVAEVGSHWASSKLVIDYGVLGCSQKGFGSGQPYADLACVASKSSVKSCGSIPCSTTPGGRSMPWEVTDRNMDYEEVGPEGTAM